MGDFTIECPECGSNLGFNLDDVARERTVRCSRGCSVELKDDGGGARMASTSLRDLEKTIGKLNRTINL